MRHKQAQRYALEQHRHTRDGNQMYVVKIVVALGALAFGCIPLSGMASAQVCATGDTCATFNLEDFASSAGTLTGTVTVDTTQGYFTSVDFTGNLYGLNTTFDGNDFTRLDRGFFVDNLDQPGVHIPDQDWMNLVVDAPTLVGYSGGQLCNAKSGFTLGSNCDDVGTVSTTFLGGPVKSGELVAAPELDPASTSSGLTLLLGCLFVLSGRRQKSPAGPLLAAYRIARTCH